jgi:hypothetical protein
LRSQDLFNHSNILAMTQVSVIADTYRNLGSAWAADISLVGRVLRSPTNA